MRGERLEKAELERSEELEEARGERLDEARAKGDGLGGVEAKVKVNESSTQSGGSMSAKNCGAGAGV